MHAMDASIQHDPLRDRIHIVWRTLGTGGHTQAIAYLDEPATDTTPAMLRWEHRDEHTDDTQTIPGLSLTWDEGRALLPALSAEYARELSDTEARLEKAEDELREALDALHRVTVALDVAQARLHAQEAVLEAKDAHLDAIAQAATREARHADVYAGMVERLAAPRHIALGSAPADVDQSFAWPEMRRHTHTPKTFRTTEGPQVKCETCGEVLGPVIPTPRRDDDPADPQGDGEG